MDESEKEFLVLAEYPVINQKNLEKLRNNTVNNPQLLKEIFQSFLEESSSLINDIKSAIEKQNHDLYYTAVHSLKGLSGTIGCSRMFELLKMMDALNKENQYNRSQDYYQQLQITFSETADEINKEVLN